MSMRLWCLSIFVACSTIGVAQATLALDVKIRGSYVDEVTGDYEKLDAVVVLESDGRLQGAMAPTRAPDSDVSTLGGQMSNGQLSFQFSTPTGEQGTFTGRVQGSYVSGTYQVGERKGTWAGVWEPADAAQKAGQ